jgi:subfamily B ATP-binding cassette protein MsbA
MNPINRIAGYVGDFSRSLVGVARIYEILDLPTEEDLPDAQELNVRVEGELVFDQVSFTYPKNETPVLHAFSVRIQAGSVVAFVGPSGAGKTTITSLIPRFYEVNAGRILLDGIPLTELSLSRLRNAIGIVPQDPQLFQGSIADNIRYGRLSATHEELVAAAREANAEEFIAQLPDGYDTLVGERGARLSGGQRQRIAIARAILRDPRILILDEATSALDTHSERLIEEALDTLLAGRTTIIIAHRLSTIRRADTIFYIDNGSIQEAGTHSDLLASGGHYASLFTAQFSH